ncbi:MAG: hypothetical protein EOO75_15590 [Myxococcales bacterium]|nr:MAG: hypothetical protein EOO75_15590 [Myxococcales bacterium]
MKTTSSLSDELLDWLARSHDPDQPLLVVRPRGRDLEVLRADGTEISATEHREVFARLVVHALEPDCPSTMRVWPRRATRAASAAASAAE